MNEIDIKILKAQEKMVAEWVDPYMPVKEYKLEEKAPASRRGWGFGGSIWYSYDEYESEYPPHGEFTYKVPRIDESGRSSGGGECNMQVMFWVAATITFFLFAIAALAR